MENWKSFLNEEEKDSEKIAKIVLFDDKGKVLFLKRSKHVEKFSGKWDIPGGHIHENEKTTDGLEREVKEETGLNIKKYEKFKVVGKMHYFKGKMPKGKIILSKEHSEHKLCAVRNIKNPNKFEKIAQEILENDEF